MKLDIQDMIQVIDELVEFVESPCTYPGAIQCKDCNCALEKGHFPWCKWAEARKSLQMFSRMIHEIAREPEVKITSDYSIP